MNQNYEAFVRSYVENQEMKDPRIRNPWIYIYAVICLGFALLGISTFSNILPATVCTAVSIVGTLMSSLVMVVFWDLYQKALKQNTVDDITDISTEAMP